MEATDTTPNYRAALKATAVFLVWTLAWLASLAFARFAPDVLWAAQPTWSWVAVGANLLIGVGVIVAFTRHLREADELDRKIMLDALAVTLGVVWVTGFAYVVANAAGLITIDIAALLAAPGVVFVIAFVAGKIRYR